MHRDFNRPETQSRAVSSDGSVNVVLEPLDTETIVTHEEFYHNNGCKGGAKDISSSRTLCLESFIPRHLPPLLETQRNRHRAAVKTICQETNSK